MRPQNLLEDDYSLPEEELGPDGLPIQADGATGGGGGPFARGTNGWQAQQPGQPQSEGIGNVLGPAGGGGDLGSPTGGAVRPPAFSLGAFDPRQMTIGQFASGGQSTEGFPEQFSAPPRRNPGAFSYADFKAPSVEEALNDPGLQARLKLGSEALMYSKAAQGLTNDTGTMNALQDYGQGLAAQGYGDVFARDLSGWQNNRQNAMDAFSSGRSLDDSDYAQAWQRYQDDYKIFTDQQDRQFDKTLKYASA